MLLFSQVAFYCSGSIPMAGFQLAFFSFVLHDETRPGSRFTREMIG
jgi:hypothetical protein